VRLCKNSMKTVERRQAILDILRERKSAKLTDLASGLDVSLGTIRNDLDYLVETQQVIRERGRVVLSNNPQIANPDFAARARTNQSNKQRIARRAAGIINDGDAIFLDSSTTAFHMTPFLQDYRRLTIVTNGIETALALARNPSFKVILMGGLVQPTGEAVTGRLGEQALDGLNVKTAFVSCGGLTLKAGLTDADIEIAELKRKVVERASLVVALVESSKFGKVYLSAFASIDQVGQVLTDESVDRRFVDELRGAAVTLTVCGDSSTTTYTPADDQRTHHRIGFANLAEDRPFAVDVRRGLEHAAKQSGCVDLIVADNQYDNRVALEVADYLLDQQVDLIIEYHFDENTGVLLMERFRRADIPVIAVDIPIVGATYFGVDSYRSGYDGGRALGEWIKTQWDGQLDRLIVLPSASSHVLSAARINGQIDGLREALGDLPPEKIICTRGTITVEAAYDEMGEVLAATTGLRHLAVISFSDALVEGAIRAAREAGRIRDLVCVSQGTGTRFIREEVVRPDSCIVAAVLFRPEEYGSRLIALALRLLRGEPVPPVVYIEHVVVDREGIADYYPER
jgi:ribose transport system substrate-binding protein